ncbi:MAG: hypothetical protein AAB724_01720, partial [Patescibacteria group bacterium]
MPFQQWEVWGISGWIVFAFILFTLLAVAALLYNFLMRTAFKNYLRRFHDPGKDYPKELEIRTTDGAFIVLERVWFKGG